MKRILLGMLGMAILLIIGLILAGCPTDSGGGGVPEELIGKWAGSGTGAGGQYIEFTSENMLLIRNASSTGTAIGTYTVTSVSGGEVEIQSANANTSDGSFKYELNDAKTEMTVSDQSMNGNSVGYSKYTKL